MRGTETWDHRICPHGFIQLDLNHKPDGSSIIRLFGLLEPPHLSAAPLPSRGPFPERHRATFQEGSDAYSRLLGMIVLAVNRQKTA